MNFEKVITGVRFQSDLPNFEEVLNECRRASVLNMCIRVLLLVCKALKEFSTNL